MEPRVTIVVLLVLSTLSRGIVAHPRDQNSRETFTLYFRQGEEKIPVKIDMDMQEKTAYVISNSSTEKTSSLYDYKSNVIAYKDSSKKVCFLEKMLDPSLVYERRILRTLRNQVLLGTPELLYAYNSPMIRRQVVAFAGRTVDRFCAGTNVFKIMSTQDKHLGRRKREATRNSYMERTYSHHEQHSQSYAKFGHETLTMKGGLHKLNDLTPSYLLPSLMERKQNYYSTDPDSRNNGAHHSKIQESSLKTYPQSVKRNMRQNTNIGRSIRELPRTRAGYIVNPNAYINPSQSEASGSSSQISSEIYSGRTPASSGFTATGKFDLANARANGYGNGLYAAYGDSSTQNGRSSVANGKTYGNLQHSPSYLTFNKYSENGRYLPSQTVAAPHQDPSNIGSHTYYAQPLTGGKPTVANGHGVSAPLSYISETPQISQPTANGRLTNGHMSFPYSSSHHQQVLEQSHRPDLITGHIDRNLHQSDISQTSQQRTGNGHRAQDFGLSSQSQVEMNEGNAQAGASAQGAFGPGNAQTQVQGGASKGGNFQAQAQSGSNQGNSQSQTHGSDSGAQSSASTQLLNVGQSQTQAQLSYGSRIAQANSQTSSNLGSINAQSQGNHLGGQASSQSQGQGGTSSSAQVGFEGKDGNYPIRQRDTSPFAGRAVASSHGGFQDGQSQTYVHGNLNTGSAYRASAQGSYGQPQQNTGPIAIAMPGADGQNYLTQQNLSSQSISGSPSLKTPQALYGTSQQGSHSNLGTGPLQGIDYSSNYMGHVPDRVSQNGMFSPINQEIQPSHSSSQTIPSRPSLQTQSLDKESQYVLQHGGGFYSPSSNGNAAHSALNTYLPAQHYQQNGYSTQTVHTAPDNLQTTYKNHLAGNGAERNTGINYHLPKSHGQLQTPSPMINGNLQYSSIPLSQTFKQDSIKRNNGVPMIPSTVHTTDTARPSIQRHKVDHPYQTNGRFSQTSQTQHRNGYRTRITNQIVPIPTYTAPSSHGYNINSNSAPQSMESNRGQSIIQAQVQGIYLPANGNGRGRPTSHTQPTSTNQNGGRTQSLYSSTNGNIKRPVIPSSFRVTSKTNIQNGGNGRSQYPQKQTPIYSATNGRVVTGGNVQSTNQQALPTRVNGRQGNCGVSTCSSGYRFIKTVKICLSPCQ